MHKFFFISLFVLSFKALALAPFTLNCKGGPSMTLGIGKRFNKDTISYTLIFTKAPQGTNSRALLPGECAWAHRALNASEFPILAPEDEIDGGIRYTLHRGQHQIKMLPGNDDYSKRHAYYFELIEKAIKGRSSFSVVAPLGRRQLNIEKVLVNQ